jgi:hypothetical protein
MATSAMFGNLSVTNQALHQGGPTRVRFAIVVGCGLCITHIGSFNLCNPNKQPQMWQ